MPAWLRGRVIRNPYLLAMLAYCVLIVNDLSQHGCFAALLRPENNGPLLISYQRYTALENLNPTGNPGNDPVVDLVKAALRPGSMGGQCENCLRY